MWQGVYPPSGCRSPWIQSPLDAEHPPLDADPPQMHTPLDGGPSGCRSPLWTDKHLSKHYLAPNFASGGKNVAILLQNIEQNVYLNEFIKNYFFSFNYGTVKPRWSYAKLKLGVLKK